MCIRDSNKVDASVFVKFKLVKGQLIIKINQNHTVMIGRNSYFKPYQDEVFWEIVGQSLLSNIGQITLIEKFYASIGRVLSDQK